MNEPIIRRPLYTPGKAPHPGVQSNRNGPASRVLDWWIRHFSPLPDRMVTG